MRFNIQDFKTDDDLAVEGVWIDFGGGARFKLAAFDNPNMTEAIRKRYKPYQDLGREVPVKEAEEIASECLARHVVLGWEGVFDGDDELPYSVDAAKRLMKEVPRILGFIMEEAKKVSNFKEKAAEELEGNSERA